MSEKITKVELAAKLGISRPTLDKYLSEGFPKKITELFTDYSGDTEYERIVLENEIRLTKYRLAKLEAELEGLPVFDRR